MLKALTCLPWSPQTPFNPGSWSQLVLFLATFCYLNTEFAQTGNDYTWYGIQKIYKTVIIQSPSLHSPAHFSPGSPLAVLSADHLEDGRFFLLKPAAQFQTALLAVTWALISLLVPLASEQQLSANLVSWVFNAREKSCTSCVSSIPRPCSPLPRH